MFNPFLNTRTELFTLGIIFLAISVIFEFREKHKWSIAFLLIASASLCYFACTLDPFLNAWDERFHALVAKNLMHHPLMPTLYDETPVYLPYDITRWDLFHIWLHKQPLFLWQISLSFKIFGVNETALRIPSAVLVVATTYATYRSGCILKNERAGFYSAFFMVTSFYLIQLVSGYQELEHNDISFLSYISLSIWFWLEYIRTGRKYWVILIGIFSGFAILCKWIVGLLVYLAWGIYSVMSNKTAIRKYRDIAMSLLVTCLVVLPWQILILKWYSFEAKEEYRYMSLHFTQPIEGHGGPWFYHFQNMGEVFGYFVPYLIIPALIVFFLTTKDKRLFFAFAGMILFVFLFFSLAETKMQSFTLVLALPLYCVTGFALEYLFTRLSGLIKKKILLNLLISSALVTVAYYQFNFSKLDEIHSITTNDSNCRIAWKNNKKIFQNLHLSQNSILFNVPGKTAIDAMFYSGITSYNLIPSEEQISELEHAQRKIYLLAKPGESLPDYIKNDTRIGIINADVVPCE